MFAHAHGPFWLGLEFDENSDTMGPTTWIVTEDGSSLIDRERLAWPNDNWEVRYNSDPRGPGWQSHPEGDNESWIGYQYPFHRVFSAAGPYYRWALQLKTDERELDCLCWRRLPGKNMIEIFIISRRLTTSYGEGYWFT